MPVEQIGNAIQGILRQHCPSAEVAIVSNQEAGRNQPAYYLGVSGGDAVEVDKIQSIMTMAGAEFVKWQKDKEGDLMIYRVPVSSSLP